MPDLLSELLFLFQRLNWVSLLDLFLVTLVFFTLLMIVRGTQAMMLMRGVILLVISLSLLTSLVNLPAFSWLIRTSLPALLLAIPVIFAPEIRRARPGDENRRRRSSDHEQEGEEAAARRRAHRARPGAG